MAYEEYLAVILAGGKGSGLKELTDSCAKCVLPVCNKPMVYYPLKLALDAGFSSVVVLTVSSAAGRAVRELVGSELFPGDQASRVEVVEVGGEEELGTVEVLLEHKDALRHFSCDLLVLSCDSLVQVNLQQLADVHRAAAPGTPLVCALAKSHVHFNHVQSVGKRNKKRKPYGDIIGVDRTRQKLLHYTALADIDDTISIRTSSANSVQSITLLSQFVDPHVYVLSAQVLREIDADESLRENLTRLKSELIPFLVKRSLKDPQRFPPCRVLFMTDNRLCWRADNIANYCEANRRMLESKPKKCSLSGNLKMGEKNMIDSSSVGEDCTVGSGCKISGCTIFKGVKIGDNCNLQNCVIASGAVIGAGSDISNSLIASGEVVDAESKISNQIIRKSFCVDI